MHKWDHSPEQRAKERKVYGDPEYQRNRAIALRRAAGACQQCGHRHTRLQVDHIHGTAAGHGLANLQVLCRGPGTCDCHGRKTGREGRAGQQRSAQRGDPDFIPRTQW